MKLEGRTHILAPRARAYACLTNAEFVAQCAPGVRRVETIEPEKTFKIVAEIGFGALKTPFDTRVEFLDKQPDSCVRIVARGSAPGSIAEVGADLVLTDGADGGTDLAWSADVSVTGEIASVAMRMVDGVVREMSAQFIACAKGKIEHSVG